MGRQLQIAATTKDEISLLSFIHSIDKIRVFRFHTRDMDGIWILDWQNDLPPCDSLSVWPQSFPWTPEFKQTSGKRCPKESRGLFYISNTQQAPLLEIMRSNLEQHRFGRIYWAGKPSSSMACGYDADGFSKLADKIWNWIRRQSYRVPNSKNSPYFLPDAWHLYGDRFVRLSQEAHERTQMRISGIRHLP
jgi:hypothetical protein